MAGDLESNNQSLSQVEDEDLVCAYELILAYCTNGMLHDGIAKTPQRAANALKEMVSGYAISLDEMVNGALYPCQGHQWVQVKDITFASLCEHHLLPFFGTVDVAYLPNDTVIGLSKIPRIIDMFSKRIQLQERLGQQIADTLLSIMDAQHVVVNIKGQHSCMFMRGIKKQGAYMVTRACAGQPLTESQLQMLKDLNR